jgi:hypothetical protein
MSLWRSHNGMETVELPPRARSIRRNTPDCFDSVKERNNNGGSQENEQKKRTREEANKLVRSNDTIEARSSEVSMDSSNTGQLAVEAFERTNRSEQTNDTIEARSSKVSMDASHTGLLTVESFIRRLIVEWLNRHGEIDRIVSIEEFKLDQRTSEECFKICDTVFISEKGEFRVKLSLIAISRDSKNFQKKKKNEDDTSILCSPGSYKKDEKLDT